jgi:hypothetical protein
MKRKSGRPRSQPRTERALETLAQANGYTFRARKKDPVPATGEKKFLPDLIAEPVHGTYKRIFEVEATVNNNTIYKSIASLLHYLAKYEGDGYLVVADKGKDFAQGCLDEFKRIVHAFSKTTSGRHPKVPLSIIAFSEVKDHEQKVLSWLKNGKKGRPPVCPFFPRS